MQWAKSPVVAGSIACAACLAVATTLPATAPVAEKLAQTVNANVHLAVDFSALAAFDAIPGIQALLATGDTSGLASLDGIPAFLAFLNDGDPAAFEPDADGNGGYAALSGLNSLVTGNLAGIDAFSALGATGLGDLDSVNGIPAFQNYLATGDLHSFDQNDDQPGYAALSATGTYQDIAGGNLSTVGNLDSLSAIPVFVGTDADGNGTGVFNGGGIAALSGYDALSAIPAYLAPAPAADPPAANRMAPQGATLLVASQDEVTTTGDVTTTGGTGGTSSNKQNQVRNSAKFSPVGLPVLFGSGKGGGADNGMPGWGNMLKKLGLNGGEPAKPAAGPAAGAEGPGAGDPGGDPK